MSRIKEILEQFYTDYENETALVYRDVRKGKLTMEEYTTKSESIWERL